MPETTDKTPEEYLELARRVAAVVGASSAAAAALRRYDALIADGRDARIIKIDGVWFVGHE